MDLYAYKQIKDLEKVAKDNGIEVPRLRGYRLMKNEETVSEEDIKVIMKNCEISICESLCRSYPFWDGNSCCGEYSMKTLKKCKLYLVGDEDGEYTDIRWDRIHGWKRRVLKFEIKKEQRKMRKQIEMWNKYAGKENILYIHSRIGGNNWNHFGGNELLKKPWFLDKVDDGYDSTYCNIYAKVKI